MSESSVTPQATPRQSWLTGELLWLGLLLPAVAVATSQFLLAWSTAGGNRPLAVALTLGTFVAQVGILSVLVGSRVKARPYWWGILAWVIVLVDLQVFALAGPDDGWSNPVKAFGHAFGAAQIGLATCWGILGKLKTAARLPLAGLGFVLSWVFCLSLNGRGNWTSVMFLQCLATITVCVGLRWFHFRIEDYAGFVQRTGSTERKMQFSILHLFYWTTGVAVLIGLGRLIGLEGIVELTIWSSLTVYAPAFTLITMIALWAALGAESPLIRFPVLLTTLPGVGMLLALFENWRSNSGRWNGDWRMMPWNTTLEDKLVFWTVWASLAGMLLAALVLVFRARGERLLRGGAAAAGQQDPPAG